MCHPRLQNQKTNRILYIKRTLLKGVAMNIPLDLSRFEALVGIVAYLRGPQGCPWDRRQTHQSLREHLLEESYEVLEALDEDNKEKLCTELGDLLMQIVMHAHLAEENGNFTMGDVTSSINRKLVSRHPHVFGEENAPIESSNQETPVLTAEGVLVRWEELKRKERRGQGGMLDSVPQALPALAYSQSIQGRVARIGFDWPDDSGILEKLTEEIAEFKAAPTPAERAAEFGDVLFTLVNYARHQDIDPEAALREANTKFYRRFSHMEALAHTRGLELEKISFDEMNRLWDEAKKDMSE